MIVYFKPDKSHFTSYTALCNCKAKFAGAYIKESNISIDFVIRFQGRISTCQNQMYTLYGCEGLACTMFQHASEKIWLRNIMRPDPIKGARYSISGCGQEEVFTINATETSEFNVYSDTIMMHTFTIVL